MRKKLFFIASMVALMVCLLVITAGAAKIGDFEYSLNKETKEATFGDNRSYTGDTVYIPSTVEYEGVTYTVTAIGGNALYNKDDLVTLYIPSTVTKLTGGTFCGCDSLTSVYVDTENLTYIGWGGMSYNDSDRDSKLGSNIISYYPTSEYGKENPQRTLDMKLENLTHVSAGSLQGLYVDSLVLGGKLTSIPKQLLRGSKFTSLTIKGEVTEIGSWLVPGCSNLTTVIVESRSLKIVGETAFSGVKTITNMTIDLSKVTNIGSSAFRFSGDRHITTPDAQWFNLDGEKIVDLSSLQAIGSQAFAGSNIGSAKIIWPTGITAENLGSDADSSTFRNAGITGTIYIDAADGCNLLIDTWCFRNNEYDTIVFGPNVTKVGASFSDVKSLKTVVFLADSVDVTSGDLFKNCSGINFYFKALTTNTEFSQANEIPIVSGAYSNYGVCGFVTNLVTADGDVTIGTVSHTTSDEIDNSLCPVGKVLATRCEYCTYAVYTVGGEEVEAKAHNYNLVGSIVYEDYFDLGFITNKCECGAEQASEEPTAEALFVYYGYSMTETKIGNKLSMSQFFGINQQAFTDFKNATDKPFEYGIVVSSNADPLNESNAGLIVAGKTHITKEEKIAHDYIIVSVAGFVTEGESANADKGLAFCMFIKDGEKTSYLDNGKTVTTVELKSYNTIKAMLENN